MEIEEMASFTNMIMEATKGLDHRYLKGATNDCFIFDSWFEPKSLEESTTDVSAHMVVMIKINTKGLSKYYH